MSIKLQTDGAERILFGSKLKTVLRKKKSKIILMEKFREIGAK